MNTKNKVNLKKGFSEILIICTVIFSFLTAACINKSSMFSQYRTAFLITGLGDFLLVISWAWIGTSFWDKINSWKLCVLKINKNKGLLLALLYCLMSRIFQLDDMPRWDSLVYYRELMSACRNFDFSLNTFVRGFALASHPTQGFAAIAGIGEFLNPGGYAGVLVIQLLVNLLMSFCLYRIFEIVLPKCSYFYHLIATCAVLSTPLTLGTFSYLQPDAGTVYFFVFVIYCYLYKKNILMFFSMLLLILSKEVGIIILAGFGAGIFFERLLRGRNFKAMVRNLKKFFKEPLGIGMLAAALFFIGYLLFYFKQGGVIWSISNDNIEGFSTFSFQPDFVIFKWKQFFVLNFNWLIWAGVLAMCLFLIFQAGRKRGYSQKIGKIEIVVAVALAVVALAIFYCTYVTYALPRYHVLADFCGVFLFAVLFGICVPEGLLKYVVSSLIGILLFLEAYVTIDPVSLIAFQNTDIGNTKIITERFKVGGLTDFCVYNHQFNYLNKAYSHVLKDVDYYDGMDVLIWDSMADYEIWGKGVYWDLEEQNRTMTETENTVTVNAIERRMIENGEVQLKPEAVFVLTPQFGIVEDVAVSYLQKYYEIRYKGTVNIPLGGEVTFFVCDLLGQKVETE